MVVARSPRHSSGEMISVENVAVSGRRLNLTLVSGRLAKREGMMSYLDLCFMVESTLGGPSGGNILVS